MDEKRVVIKEQSLKDLADVLREKSGTTAQYDIDELVQVARELGMPELEELLVTENGEYTSSKYGFSKVTVDVKPEQEEITITANGEYTPETYGFSKIIVTVPNPELEELTLTEAGTYFPTKYGFSKVIADVPVYRDFEEEVF